MNRYMPHLYSSCYISSHIYFLCRILLAYSSIMLSQFLFNFSFYKITRFEIFPLHRIQKTLGNFSSNSTFYILVDAMIELIFPFLRRMYIFVFFVFIYFRPRLNVKMFCVPFYYLIWTKMNTSSNKRKLKFTFIHKRGNYLRPLKISSPTF